MTICVVNQLKKIAIVRDCICIILLTESMIEAANVLNEVTNEPQGPNEVLELQPIPKIPGVEPLSQQETNSGKTCLLQKI